MRLINKTHWHTTDLARIARKVVRAEFPKATFGDRVKRIVVEVNYNRLGERGMSCSGHAYLNGNHIFIHVPSGAVDTVDFAHVVAHESGHCKGFNHKDTKFKQTLHWHRSGYTRKYFAWAGQMPIRQVFPVMKPASPISEVEGAAPQQVETKTERFPTDQK